MLVPTAELVQELLEEAHNGRFSVHPGATKMYHDLREAFWWPGMKKSIATYVAKCLTCQKVKIEHQKPAGPLQPLEIPEWKWESISMDFVVGLPKTQRKFDAIWVIVDRLTKSAHFLPMRVSDSMERLAQLYIDEIVRLHGVPLSIVSDRDPRFTSRFWGALQQAFGSKLRLSTAYHPQTDGQTERTIQTLEDMLRACVLEQGGSWDRYLALAEFAYNNSYHASLGMAPYEVLYGRKCRSPTCWTEVGERALFGPDLVEETSQQIRRIRDNLKKAQDRQKSYADNRRRPLDFEVGEHVFLRVSPSKGIGQVLGIRKLSPRYLGPFQILRKIGPVAYRLALYPPLHNLHDVFHVSQLRKYVPDPSHVVRPDEVELREDWTMTVRPVRILARSVKQLRNKSIPLVKVLWHNRSEEEATWERESDVRRDFPELFDTGKLLQFRGRN